MALIRLIPILFLLFVLVAVVGLLFGALNRQASLRRTRNEHTHRPRGDAGGAFGRGGDRPGAAAAGAHWVVPRAELEGLRDAYSSATLDPAQPLFRCGNCQAYYHAASLQALRAENGGRCVLCRDFDLRPVHVA